MNTDYIFLNPAPMPYLTDCDYKKFEPNEYHISRIVDFFVLIFMLRGSLHFIEDDVSVSVQEGEWYIQRKNLLQDADRPSTEKNIASAIKMQLQDLCFYYIRFLFISKVQNQPYTLQN